MARRFRSTAALPACAGLSFTWSRTLKSLIYCLFLTLALSLTMPAQAGKLQDCLARADKLFEQQDWGGYAALYRTLAEQHPNNGLYWYRLGNGERRLGRIEAAIAAFDRAYALGHQSANAARWLAALEAARGNGEQATHWFEQARRDRLVNAELTLLQDSKLHDVARDSRYSARLFPLLAGSASTEDKWRADLAFFDLRVRESHWNLFAQVDAARWEAGIDSLKTDLPRLADWQIQIRLNELLRLAKSGHSWVLPGFDGPDPFHAARIQIGKFADGWFVKSGAPEHRALVGRRIVSIGGAEPDRVLRALAPSIPHDSPSGLGVVGAMLMTVPEYLQYYGFGSSRTSLQLTLASENGGTEEFSVAAPALDQTAVGAMFQAALPPRDWAIAYQPQRSPRWLRNTGVPAWFELTGDEGLIYFQLNAVRDNADETLEQVATRLEQALARREARGLVLDVRLNNGGNGELLEPLLKTLTSSAKLQRPGALYVLIGGRTFSAASLLIADIERRLPATFVGGLSGAGPTHMGEDNLILLPNSGTKVLAATRLFVRSFSDDKRSGIAPHIEVPDNFSDWRSGHDAVMAAVLADWEASKPRH